MNKISGVKLMTRTTEANILGFTETQVTKEAINSVTLEDFTIVSYYCGSIHQHEDAIIYVHNEYVRNSLDFTSGNEYSSEMNIEVCVCIIKYGVTKLGIVSVYAPPTGDVHIFFKNFTKLFLAMKTRCVINIILCADLNIDWIGLPNDQIVINITIIIHYLFSKMCKILV